MKAYNKINKIFDVLKSKITPAISQLVDRQNRISGFLALLYQDFDKIKEHDDFCFDDTKLPVNQYAVKKWLEGKINKLNEIYSGYENLLQVFEIHIPGTQEFDSGHEETCLDAVKSLMVEVLDLRIEYEARLDAVKKICGVRNLV